MVVSFSFIYFFFVCYFLAAWMVSMILATTEGSDSVEISPKLSSSPLRIFRRIRRMILPLRVLGRSSTTKTPLGAAKGPIDLRTCMTRSLPTCSFVSLPSLRATKALTACPVSSSVTPTTAASATWSIGELDYGYSDLHGYTYGAQVEQLQSLQ